MNIRATLLLAFAFCIFSTSYSFAQAVPKGSCLFSVGYGAPNLPAIIVSAWGENGSTGFGPITCAFQYAFSRFFVLGAQVGYVRAISNPTAWEEIDGKNSRTYYYTADMSIVTAMVKADTHYRKRGKRGDIYSSASVGYGFAKLGITGRADPDKETLKISGLVYSAAMGYRFMITNNIGVFTEAGYGLMGFSTTGLTIRFGGEENREWDYDY